MAEEVDGRMTGQELLYSGTGLIILLTLIEIAPIKINPWKAIGRSIGRAINSEVLDKVSALEADVQSIREDIEEQAAVDCRARILRFGDEVLHGDEHSKDHFDQTLRDIATYERYCAQHPNFENNVTELTGQRIKDVYMKRLDENDFL